MTCADDRRGGACCPRRAPGDRYTGFLDRLDDEAKAEGSGTGTLPWAAGSAPMSPIQRLTMRAYCRVERCG